MITFQSDRPVRDNTLGPIKGFRFVGFDKGEWNGKPYIKYTFKKSKANGGDITVKSTWVFNPDKGKEWMLTNSIEDFCLKFMTHKQFEEHFSGKSFKDIHELASYVEKVLPVGYDKREGTLLVGYNKGGYWECPASPKWDKEKKRYLPFFTLTDEELMELPSHLLLKEQTEKVSIASNAVDSNSEDLPF